MTSMKRNKMRIENDRLITDEKDFWLAEITGRCPKWRIKRDFMTPILKNDWGNRSYHFPLKHGVIYSYGRKGKKDSKLFKYSVSDGMINMSFKQVHYAMIVRESPADGIY